MPMQATTRRGRGALALAPLGRADEASRLIAEARAFFNRNKIIIDAAAQIAAQQSARGS